MDTIFCRVLVLITTLVLAPTFTWALDDGLDDVEAKIRTAEHEHSQIMSTEHWLTNVYGPRPTGHRMPKPLHTFEAIHEQDVRDAATLVASLAFSLANRGAP